MASIVDSKFYPAFGALIYSYATVEMGIKYCTAAMMKTDMPRALIAFSPYSSTALANVAKSLADEMLKPEFSAPMRSLVGRWQAHNDLRTYIAHFRWRTGTRPGSIRPTTWDIRNGKLRVKGFDPTESDYTVDEIFKAALELANLNEEIKTFLETSGLRQIIDSEADD